MAASGSDPELEDQGTVPVYLVRERKPGESKYRYTLVPEVTHVQEFLP